MGTTKALFIGFALGFIKLKFVPDVELFIWAFIAMAVDFLTGVLKAKLNKQPITSTRMRESVVKSLQYVGLIIGCTILGNVMEKDNELVLWISNGMLLFIIYVEVYSIIENFRDMNPESKASTIVFTPLLALLTLSIVNNPVIKLLKQKEAEVAAEQPHE